MRRRTRGVIARLSRQLNASATHEGLTPPQASALGLITWRGPLSLAELAELAGLNPTMVSRIVGPLDELALIQRKQNPHDLRAALVEITPAGQAVNERIRAERGNVVSGCLDRLPAAQRAPTDRAHADERLSAVGRVAELARRSSRQLAKSGMAARAASDLPVGSSHSS